MKKGKYKVVDNPLETYHFSFAYAHASEIGAYIFGLAWLVFALFMIYFSKTLLYLVLLIIPLPFLMIGMGMTKSIRQVKKIMDYGNIVDGEVVSYKRVRGYSNTPNNTVLNVTFHYNGTHTCSVRVGHKLPQLALASNKCRVYIYENCVFVTGFDRRKRGTSLSKFPKVE